MAFNTQWKRFQAEVQKEAVHRRRNRAQITHQLGSSLSDVSFFSKLLCIDNTVIGFIRLCQTVIFMAIGIPVEVTAVDNGAAYLNGMSVHIFGGGVGNDICTPLEGTAVYRCGKGVTYYCQYVLGNVDLVMPLSAAEKLATVAGIALLPKVLPRYGKRNLICVGCILGVAGQLLFLMNITSVSLGVVTCIMRGIGIAPFYGVQYSLPSDAIEYGQWKTGKRVEGLMFSSMSMGQKAGSGLTSAIMGGILSAAYFDGTKATAAEQSAEAIRVIKGFYLYVPIAIWVVMFVIAACYQLDKVYDKMMRELIQRESGEESVSVPGEIQSMPLPEASGNRINVAIGRLYGSSGRKIAEGVAKALDCKVYDRQIICLMAEKFGMEKADLESVRQYLDSYNYEDSELTFSPYGHSSAGAAADYTGVQMFEVQSRIIRELSERRPGVFLGRCANYVLRGEPHTYSFFVYADDAYREKEGQEYYKGQSLGELKKRDQIRNEYYEKFTGIRRDDPHYYDMVINVSKTGVAGAASLILDYIRNKEEEKGGNAS